MSWNRSKDDATIKMTPKKSRNWVLYSLLLGCALILIGVVVLSFFRHEETPPQVIKTPVAVTNAPVAAIAKPIVTNEIKKVRKLASKREPIRVEKVNNKVTKKYYADGTWETSIDPYALKQGQVRRPNPFKSLLEKHLSKFAIPGDDDPILDEDFTDEEARKMLNHQIEIADEDDEEMKYRKAAVNQFKDELKAAMDAGMSANDYLKELRNRQRHEANLVRESRRLLMDEIKNGTRESAVALMNKLNENLDEQGVRHMYLTQRMKEQLGIDHD